MKWKRPSHKTVKVNVDASFHVDEGKGSTGAVNRDASGVFLAAACSQTPHVTDVHTTESMAMKEGPAGTSKLTRVPFHRN